MTMPVESDGRTRNRWRLARWATAGLLLVLPLAAMQFTQEVKWEVADFIVFGTMLAAALGAYELATKTASGHAYRLAAGISLAAAFILVWANGAVGIIGDEKNPANLMYGGVLATGLVGALLARFRPQGMALAMIAAAVAQLLVAVIALVAGLGQTLAVTAIFVALWLTSAAFFRKAARDQGGSTA